MNGKLLGRYDAETVSSRLQEAGIYAVLNAKGFSHFAVVIDDPEHGLAHTRLLAYKGGDRFLLLDACVTEMELAPELFRERGYPMERALELVSLYWLREEDPTAQFSPDRPPLPLQHHPGLGVLRVAFQVIVRMARELGKDGVACTPKFFHDAVIFFRSRLFLFLDPAQQGRFEALLRDLRVLSLGTASLLLACNAVRDGDGQVVRWELAPQVLPLSESFRAYFNSSMYAEAAANAFAGSHFSWADEAVTQVQKLLVAAS